MGKRRVRQQKRRVNPERERMQRIGQQYRCGHCNSRYNGVKRDSSGAYRLKVSHDDGCPVLRGAVLDVPDMHRAADAAGVSLQTVVFVRRGARDEH